MTTVFIIFMLAIIALAVIVFITAGVSHGNRRVSDREYIDPDGDHEYYDRSSIEKKRFAKANPSVKGIRTLRRLFRRGDAET